MFVECEDPVLQPLHVGWRWCGMLTNRKLRLKAGRSAARGTCSHGGTYNFQLYWSLERYPAPIQPMIRLPSWAQPKALTNLGNTGNDDISREISVVVQYPILFVIVPFSKKYISIILECMGTLEGQNGLFDISG